MSIVHSPKRLQLYAGRRRRGFTMLELVMALTIFAVIGGALFRVIEACMTTTQELYDTQRVTRQLTTFAELCRKTFATLPGDATFRVPMSEEEHGQEITFQKAPSVFLWGGSPLNYGSTTLAVRPQEDGRFCIAISRSDFKLPEDLGFGGGSGEVATDVIFEPDEQGRYWLVLVANLEWARWRFYDSRRKEWMEEWTRGERPPMVELSLMLPGDVVPFRVVFDVSRTSPVASSLIVGARP